MILISQTFEIVTQESAEHGDAEERGFNFQDTPHTFRELVELMESHPECSSGGRDYVPGPFDWFSSYPDTDYRTGAEESTAIHYSRENPPRMAKYWSKAARVAATRRAR